jgi:hypothetical protein
MEHSTQQDLGRTIAASGPDSSHGERTGTGLRAGHYDRWLIALFLLSLPFVNPWVHGDGVGYYAFARALLIEHRLDFRNDWLNADAEFRQTHTGALGRLTPENYTATGRIDNHFSIGPAILWSPFLIAAHAGVLAADAMGAHIPADGYARPYLLAMSLGTAVYGFLGLWISFLIARCYVAERWAFLATLGIWAASSLPIYMYFNPSWSHAQSAFVVALFIWHWEATRGGRSLAQWIVLGLIGGLMMDMYYVNAIVMVFPFLESLAHYRRSLASRQTGETAALFLKDAAFLGAGVVAFSPTLISKKIIFGSYFNFGYREQWHWSSPALLKVAFSADHGLLSWTPIALLAIVGLSVLTRRDRNVAIYSLITFAVYLYVIGCYQDWDGIASFGNRFFVSLTPIFIVGLAALFDSLARAWSVRRTLALATASTALLISWNFGMMYQWGMHLIPVRGPISWSQAAYNQFAVVPRQAARELEHYFLRRGNLMKHIENKDMRQLESRSHPN